MALDSGAGHDAKIDMGAVLAAVWARKIRIVLLTALILGATLFLLMSTPRLYESSADILVEPRSNIYASSSEQPAASSSSDVGVVSSQIELIKSRDTLLKVVESENLRAVPELNGSAIGTSPIDTIMRLLGRRGRAPTTSDEVVLNNLVERMTVIQQRDSRIISILVRTMDPELSARIANAVANAHVARRASLSLSDTAEASSWLEPEIEKLRVRVSAAESAVATFKVDNDLFQGTNNTSLLDQQLSTLSTQISTAQERNSIATTRATLIRSMLDKGQPIDGISDVRDSGVIQQLSQEKARLQSEQAQRSATMLNNHPVIRALNSQISEVDNQIRIEGRRVADSLQAEAEIQATIAAGLQTDLERLKGSASTATRDTVRLGELEREAAAQRGLLESYLQRYNEAISRTDSNSSLPDVRVVTSAAASFAPASPQTALVLLSVGIVALVAQIGAIIFGELISGRAIVDVPARRGPNPRSSDTLPASPYVPDEEPEADAPAPEPEQKVIAELPRAELASSGKLATLEAAAEPQTVIEQTAAIVEPAPVALTSVDEDELEFNDDLFGDDDEDTAIPVIPMSVPGIIAYDALSSDLAARRSRVIVLAGLTSHADCAVLADQLAADSLEHGLSVAIVDGGSNRVSVEPGLTDLAAGEATFGDIVQKSVHDGLAEVRWGNHETIDRNSGKPLTLIEALGDIYEVVIVLTGRVGSTSTLPMFGGLEGRMMLVSGPQTDVDQLVQTRNNLVEAGFDHTEIVVSPQPVAA